MGKLPVNYMASPPLREGVLKTVQKCVTQNFLNAPYKPLGPMPAPPTKHSNKFPFFQGGLPKTSCNFIDSLSRGIASFRYLQCLWSAKSCCFYLFSLLIFPSFPFIVLFLVEVEWTEMKGTRHFSAVVVKNLNNKLLFGNKVSEMEYLDLGCYQGEI